MPSGLSLTKEEIEKMWYNYLTYGETDLTGLTHTPWYFSKPFHSLYQRLPTNPRCRLCRLPFKGVGGALMRHAIGI
ncbi:MAG TPA: hypothetical protein VMT46_17665, partial [Anaerolineaceae bacterium]|nr:hypothetical protein [Anaerolineaceae bacterium]